MIILPEHFRYLRVQHGEVSDAEHDFPLWRERYLSSLNSIYGDLRKVLPPAPVSALDIGSGLGGIHILLAKHYGPDYRVRLVDGVSDEPVVVTHNRTFNDMDVAMHFHAVNGLQSSFFDAAAFNGIPIEEKFDLVVSFASYCFHYPPEKYLDTLVRCTHKDSVIVLDVRYGRPEWLAQLQEAFGGYRILSQRVKLLRVAFRA